MHTPQPQVCVPLGYGAPLLDATFVARPYQLVVDALLDGQLVRAHMADRGRLDGLLYPGAPLLLADRRLPLTQPPRKTDYQVVATWERGELVSLDTGLPNRVLYSALSAGILAPFRSYPLVRREVQIGASRFDFLLQNAAGEQLVVEAKSVGAVEGSLGLFPDAPTTRGARHLRELAALACEGKAAAVVFVVQRGDAQAVAANSAVDPAFALALRQAADAGVALYAYSCPLSRAGITVGASLPVLV